MGAVGGRSAAVGPPSVCGPQLLPSLVWKLRSDRQPVGSAIGLLAVLCNCAAGSTLAQWRWLHSGAIVRSEPFKGGCASGQRKLAGERLRRSDHALERQGCDGERAVTKWCGDPGWDEYW